MKHIKYTKELLEPIVKGSGSLSDVIRALGLKAAGGTFTSIKRQIKKFDLDVSHFKGQGWARGNTKYDCEIIARTSSVNTKRTVENTLIEGAVASSATIRKLYNQTGAKEKCTECDLSGDWNGKPIRLQIDHINGNGFDNRVGNLRYLCPNCHSQTETFGSKNKYKYQRTEIDSLYYDKEEPKQQTVSRSKKSFSCKVCETKIARGIHCSHECSMVSQRKGEFTDLMTYELLKKNGFNYSKTGREIGISDVAVKKRVRTFISS